MSIWCDVELRANKHLIPITISPDKVILRIQGGPIKTTQVSQLITDDRVNEFSISKRHFKEKSHEITCTDSFLCIPIGMGLAFSLCVRCV